MKKMIMAFALLASLSAMAVEQLWTKASVDYHMTDLDAGTILTYEFRNIYDWSDKEFSERKNEANALVPWAEVNTNLYVVVVAAQVDTFHEDKAEHEFRSGLGLMYDNKGFMQRNTFEAQSITGRDDTSRMKSTTQYTVQNWEHGEPFLRYVCILGDVTSGDARLNDQRFVGGWGFGNSNVKTYVYYMYRVVREDGDWTGDDILGLGIGGSF